MIKPILLGILLLGFILFPYFLFTSNGSYKKVDFSKWNQDAKNHLRGKSENELLKNLMYFLGSEGEFRGTIKQYRSPHQFEKLIIEVHEDYVPDDSIDAIDHRFIAEQKGQYLQVTEYYEKFSRSIF